jgi:hypothetical protein
VEGMGFKVLELRNSKRHDKFAHLLTFWPSPLEESAGNALLTSIFTSIFDFKQNESNVSRKMCRRKYHSQTKQEKHQLSKPD